MVAYRNLTAQERQTLRKSGLELDCVTVYEDTQIGAWAIFPDGKEINLQTLAVSQHEPVCFGGGPEV